MSIDQLAYQEAIFDLEEFLDTHPELKSYQSFIDRELNSAGPEPSQRLACLAKILNQKCFQLGLSLDRLDRCLRQVSSSNMDFQESKAQKKAVGDSD